MSNSDDSNFQLNMQRLINANQSKLITAKIESQTIRFFSTKSMTYIAGL